MSLPDALHHVFVYGSLLPGGFYHERLLAGYEVAMNPAWTRGQLYQLAPGYPGLAAGTNRVKGVVLSFSSHRLLGELDHLEGVDPEDPSTGEYFRAPTRVFSPDGAFLDMTDAYWISPGRLTDYDGQPIEYWDPLGWRPK